MIAEASNMYRYEVIVRRVRRWIEMGALNLGDRLPSIRDMSRQTGYSVVTVHHAYALLESDGIVRASPRSGFYVASSDRTFAEFPTARADFSPVADNGAPVSDILGTLIYAWRKNRIQTFGNIHPSDDLMPTQEMRTHLLRALRTETRWSRENSSTDGDPTLREIIAKRLAHRGIDARPDDVIITGSAQSALDLCLNAVAKPGETVMIESPSYYPIFDALQRRGLNVIEIYSHPTTGLDVEQFDYLADHEKIAACILMPANHCPTGVTYSDATLRRIVEKAAARKIAVIENDIFGELSHDTAGGATLKAFDLDHNVLQFGSFGPTLGPRFAVSWIVNRKHRTRMLNQVVLGEPVSVDGAVQRAILLYMRQRSYDRHLRRLRSTLAARTRRGLSLISQHFPVSCAVSRPTGGFMCWIRGPMGFNALEASSRALQRNACVPPGPLFSVTGSFRNFIGLNLSYPWDAEQQKRLKVLARLLTESVGTNNNAHFPSG